MVTNNTIIKKRGILTPLNTEKDICLFIKNCWKKHSFSKSFTDWATCLNNDGNFDEIFTKEDALDNLCNEYTLNIDDKHINLHNFFTTYLPFKN